MPYLSAFEKDIEDEIKSLLPGKLFNERYYRFVVAHMDKKLNGFEKYSKEVLVHLFITQYADKACRERVKRENAEFEKWVEEQATPEFMAMHTYLKNFSPAENITIGEANLLKMFSMPKAGQRISIRSTWRKQFRDKARPAEETLYEWLVRNKYYVVIKEENIVTRQVNKENTTPV